MISLPLGETLKIFQVLIKFTALGFHEYGTEIVMHRAKVKVVFGYSLITLRQFGKLHRIFGPFLLYCHG